MGNNNKHFKDFFTGISDGDIINLKNNYKIINVDYLEPTLVRSKMYENNSFLLSRKSDIINNMLNYYLKHNDCEIYKKTDYLCNEKEKVCICNNHAEDFRKIYDGIDYRPNEKYISWFKNE